MAHMTYETALKRAKLVERNPNPNGTTIVDLYRVSAHEENDILMLAEQIQKADENLKSQAYGKLSIILEQIRSLQSQAKQILEETDRNRQLHEAACNFTKRPGNIYHLYCKASGQKYFSLLSPEEWNGINCDQKFIGSYRLESDLSWTPIDEINKRDEDTALCKEILATRSSLLSLEYNKN